MTRSFILCCFSLQIVSLVISIISKRIASDLKVPLTITMLGLMLSTLAQLISLEFSDPPTLTSGLTLIAALLLIASTAHFILSLCAPDFVRSVNYWCAQTAFGISLLLLCTLLAGSQDSGNTLLNSFSRGFSWVMIVGCLTLIVVALSPPASARNSQTLTFRIRSVRKMLLWSIAFSLLLLFSVPATPAIATATATWCSCFAAMSTGYMIAERRLFLYDAARRALSATQTNIPDESIALAASTLDSLGNLLATQRALSTNSSTENLPIAKIKSDLLMSQLSSVTLADPSANVPPRDHQILNQINASQENDSDRLFERLLVLDSDEPHVVTLDCLRAHIQALVSLSQAHFGVDIVGNSLRMMELIGSLREEGSEHRMTVIRGEPGTGKQLFARALHNLRCNRRLLSIDLPQTADTAALESALDTLELSTEQRDTLTIRIPALTATPLANYLEYLTIIQSKFADTILLIEEPSDSSLLSSAGQLVDALTVHIPPLRERYEDLILQAIWFIDQYSSSEKLDLHGVKASALRAALINRWSLNSRELFDSIRLMLSFSRIPVDGVVSNLIVPEIIDDNISLSRWAPLRGSLQEIFLQLGGHPESIALRLGTSVDFVQLIAARLKLSLIDRAKDQDLFT